MHPQLTQILADQYRLDRLHAAERRRNVLEPTAPASGGRTGGIRRYLSGSVASASGSARRVRTPSFR